MTAFLSGNLVLYHNQKSSLASTSFCASFKGIECVLRNAQLGLIKDQKFERLSREIIELRKADPESEPPVAFIAAPEREREETRLQAARENPIDLWGI
jgi:hypothetical protein